MTTKTVSTLNFSLIPLFLLCQAANASSVSLGVAPNPSTFGHSVTLTATVTPPSATGKVTFYEGPQIVGVAAVSGGVASLVTKQLAAGQQTVKARYDGDVNNPTALSGALTAIVTATPGLSFANPAPYTTGVNPCCVVTADFNGDGILDVAVLSATSQSLYLLRGNGDGTFQPPVAHPAGPLPIAFAVGDFNGDGKPDLVVVNAAVGQTPQALDVLLGIGDGSFQAPLAITSPSNAPFSVVVGDFNNDGKADVAVANESSFDDVSIFFGNGDGTLTFGAAYSTGAPNGSFGLTLGDFNRDGFTDIAAIGSNVVILLGSANGTFTLGQTLPAGSGLNAIQTADFNNDGLLDLAVADAGSSAVSVLLGNGNGTFQPSISYGVLAAPSSLVISDFNGDGKLDIAAADFETGTQGAISVLPGTGSGAFQAALNYNAGPGAIQLAIGDFNGDGIADLAVADLGTLGNNTNPGGLSILQGGCASVTATPVAVDVNGGTSQPFTITAGPSCSWTASSPVSWVTLSQTSGTGNGSLTATVAAYTPAPVNPADRSTIIVVAGTSVSVLQDFTAEQFTDVPPSSYQFDAVNLLKGKNITAGCGATAYCPGEFITRAQMAIFIVREVYGSDNFTIQPIQYFSDVTPTTFGYMWIEKMYELGITSGCGGGNYCPTEQVTRDQMAIFLIRARYGSNTVFSYSTTPYFQDVPQTDFAFKWVQRMKQDNITAGCGPMVYCPGSAVTRGDMAIFIMRGGFNQLLPPTQPIITAVSPTTLAPGASATFTVTGLNTNFGVGTTVVNVAGGGAGGVGQPPYSMTASNVVVDSPTQLTITLTADPTAPAQPEAVYVTTGAEEAVLPNGVVVQ